MPAVTFASATEPFRPPPPGVVPNFVDPPTRAHMLITVTSIVWVISTFFVICRCYTRFFLTRIYGVSDYMFLIAYAFAVVNSALVIAGLRWGLGRRSWDVPMDWLFPHLLKNLWLQRKAYALSLAYAKIAILLAYPQLNPSRGFRNMVWILVTIVGVVTVSALLLDLFLCWPINAYWDLNAAIKHPCQSHESYIILTGASNISTDVAILLLPVVMLRNVVLTRKKKIAVVLVLATGSLASLTSVIRWIVSFRLAAAKDPTYVIADLVLWSDIEVHAGIICASLPMLKPLIRRFLPSLAWSSQEGNSSSGPRLQTVTVLDDRGRITRHELKDFRRINKNKESGSESQDNISEQHILGGSETFPRGIQLTWDIDISVEKKSVSDHDKSRQEVI